MKMVSMGKHWLDRYDWSLNLREVQYLVRPSFEKKKKTLLPCWVMNYVYSHGLYCKICDARDWKLRDVNTLHLYPPNTVFWEKVDPEISYLESAWFLFDIECENKLTQFTDAFEYADVSDPEGSLGPKFKEAAQVAFQDDNAGYWKSYSLLSQILGQLQAATHDHDEYWNLCGKAPSNKTVIVSKARQYIGDHLNQRLTVKDIAKHLKISTSTLAHYFREQTGQTPIYALQTARIELAKSLLLQGHKLQYIAMQTGFYDEFHLAKSFKNITGKTPGAFRMENTSRFGKRK